MRSKKLLWLLTLVLLPCPFWGQHGTQPARPEARGEPLPPDWCRGLPRPGIFAIYEPHQYEEVISY